MDQGLKEVLGFQKVEIVIAGSNIFTYIKEIENDRITFILPQVDVYELDQVDIELMYQDVLYKMPGIIVDMHKQQDCSVVCIKITSEFPKEIQKVVTDYNVKKEYLERRKHIRVLMNDENVKKLKIHKEIIVIIDNKKYSAFILDLSVHGLSFFILEKVYVIEQQKITIKLVFDETEACIVVGSILRCQRNADGTSIFGCYVEEMGIAKHKIELFMKNYEKVHNRLLTV